MKNFFQKNWPHFAVLAAFIVIMLFYFAPEFDGYRLKQHDVEQYIGMAQETQAFREKAHEEPLWTNSMFGGMPTIQISTLYGGNFFQQSSLWFLGFFGVPSGIFLLHLLGFYLLAMCMRIKPLIAFIGAVAFAFASYEIVVLQAGHNSKAMSVALMAPVVGAFLMAYRHNWKWGALLSGLFMSYELANNHLQVTYYLAFLLAGLGIYELIQAIMSKEIKKFLIVSGSVMAAYMLAVFINYGNISLTNDYTKHTIRGGNDVTINPNGTPATNNTEGLDKDYITNWSYGVDESFTLVSPYVKGSASVGLADSGFGEMVENSDRSMEDINEVMNAPYPVYWGEQPMTSGPVYLGVVVVFLALLGMVFIKDRSKWVFLAISMLALALSWGKNFMGLTDFFIENVPGYNKFRTVTIIMVLIELCIPIIAVLLLQRLYEAREEIKTQKRNFLIVSGAFFVFLFGVKTVGLGDNYTSKQEVEQMNAYPAMVAQQIRGIDPKVLVEQYRVDPSNPQQIQQFIDAQVESANNRYTLMKGVRQEIFDSSMNRSLIFAFLIIGVMALFFYTAISSQLIVIGVATLVFLDLVSVDLNYLSFVDENGNMNYWDNYSEEVSTGKLKYWDEAPNILYPLSPNKADTAIMYLETMNDMTVANAVKVGQKKGKLKAEELDYSGADALRVIDSYRFAALNFATNYRVFDFDGGWSSTRASYFHKSLGGYHGAKLRNIQNLFDFHLARTNNKVLDMLNVKYIIQEESLRPNPTAMGNAWFVKNIEVKETANDEILALGNEFELSNQGPGQLLVNGKPATTASVFGSEDIQYLLGRDTLDVPLSNGLAQGQEALWVRDTNGVTNLIPLMTMAADSLGSFKPLVKLKVTDEFNVRDEAVMLKEMASKVKGKKFSGMGAIKMKSYAPNKIVYSADCQGNQFAVFSEIYYPEGWKAYVDGKEVEILKTNYLLRGLELSSGKHTIEFKFDLPKYRQSNTFAIVGTGILFVLISGLAFMDLRKGKE
ncbi:MAG: hypothetical protein RL632_1343 [Bacteroidota bacterium]